MNPQLAEQRAEKRRQAEKARRQKRAHRMLYRAQQIMVALSQELEQIQERTGHNLFDYHTELMIANTTDRANQALESMRIMTLGIREAKG